MCFKISFVLHAHAPKLVVWHSVFRRSLHFFNTFAGDANYTYE
jgi:hypothetical protein